MSYVLVGTNQDFTVNDLEDLIYRDLGNRWSLTTPTFNDDLTKVKLFTTTVQADMINEARPNRPVWIWVQHRRTSAARTTQTPQGSFMGQKGYILHQSTFSIHCYLRRLTARALTFPELGQISREIEKLLFEYVHSPSIPGIQYFDNWTMENRGEVTNEGDLGGRLYHLECGIDAIYWKGWTA